MLLGTCLLLVKCDKKVMLPHRELAAGSQRMSRQTAISNTGVHWSVTSMQLQSIEATDANAFDESAESLSVMLYA